MRAQRPILENRESGIRVQPEARNGGHITALGFDPVWFGVMTIMMVIMGLIFPPVEMVAFVVSAMTKVELVTVYRGCIMLIVGVFITTALVMIFPGLATWLPSRIR